ncbi:hypothetical protein ASZ90_018469 [hydrocarbon metagenome]|uniref:Uncharacterized protein n=1 Tax=hydrocarbon metagenome TaxID=938273 RepID=A0A0W8E660_9ZZZZ
MQPPIQVKKVRYDLASIMGSISLWMERTIKWEIDIANNYDRLK